MKVYRLLATLLAAGAMLTGLAVNAVAQDTGSTTYRAELEPVNTDAVGSDVSGEVVFTISGDQLTMRVTAQGVPPNMQHWQHIHGFADSDQPSTCPGADADANGDGIIDLIETESTAGTTMIPLNDDPVSMNIPTDTYPEADADGTYTYETTVSLDDLQDAFSEQFPDAGDLDLASRVVFLHGVPEDTDLADSVATLDDIPAQVTLPIACGNLERAGAGTPAASPVTTPAATPVA